MDELSVSIQLLTMVTSERLPLPGELQGEHIVLTELGRKVAEEIAEHMCHDSTYKTDNVNNENYKNKFGSSSIKGQQIFHSIVSLPFPAAGDLKVLSVSEESRKVSCCIILCPSAGSFTALRMTQHADFRRMMGNNLPLN